MQFNKKTLVANAVVGAVLLSAGATASAEGPWSTSANVAVVSDYVWRGYTQTTEDPAIQGGLDLGHASGLYAGVWGSNVKFVEENGVADGASSEMDLYVGYSTELSNGMGVDVGYNYYLYPGSDSNLNYNFGEFYASASYSMFSLSYNYANDFFGASGKAHHIGLSVEHEYQGVGLSASINRQIMSDVDDADYTHWSLGASKSFAGLDFGLTYTGTDVEDANDPDGLADNRVVISVGKTF